MKRVEAKAASDPEFNESLERANTEYARARDALVPDDAEHVPTGGVGGVGEGVKCLHAHYAHTRSGAENPVGEMVAAWVEPLDCDVPCVDNGMRNPRWRNKP